MLMHLDMNLKQFQTVILSQTLLRTLLQSFQGYNAVEIKDGIYLKK